MPSQLPSDLYLNKTLAFIDRLVYCREEYKWAMACALVVSHNKSAFGAVPYILATGAKPGSGKTLFAFDIPLLLADNVESVDKTTTQPGMNAMFLLRDTPNTAWDDIGKIFSSTGRGGSTSPFYTQLVRSYKKNATTRMSRNGAPVKVSTYGMAFLNGLDDAVPPDLFTRCIHFRMDEAPEGLNLLDVGDDIVEANAAILKEALHSFAGQNTEFFRAFMKGQVKRIHPKLVNRRRQLWGPLFAVAYAAGGQWPQRIFDAFVTCALDASERPVLLPEHHVTLDTAKVIMGRELDSVFVSDLMEALRELPEGQYYRDAEDEYLVKELFPLVLGKPARIPGTLLFGEQAGARGQALGYSAVPILMQAAELRDMLYPPMEADALDPLEEELAFTPAVTPLAMPRKAAA